MKRCEWQNLFVAKVIVMGMIFLSSCSKHYPAPVNDANRIRVVNSSQPMVKQQKYKPKYMTVKKGDTLYSIGFDRSMDYKYLAKINGISAPYNIFPGQKLRLQVSKALLNPISKNNTSKMTKNTTASKTTTHPIKTKTVKYNPVVKKTVVAVPKIKNKNTTVQPIGKKKPVAVRPIKKTVKIIPKPVAQSNSRWLWPLKGRLLSTFLVSDVSRKGIDIAAKLNSPVLASQHGTVVYSGDGLRGYGELIIIKHSNNLLSAYAHNSSRLVKEGVAVKQGQIIAKSGKGTDGLSLLHFEIRKNGQPVNPLKYLPK